MAQYTTGSAECGLSIADLDVWHSAIDNRQSAIGNSMACPGGTACVYPQESEDPAHRKAGGR